MTAVTFAYTERQLVRCFHGRPEEAHYIAQAPRAFLIEFLQWNYSNTDPHTDWSTDALRAEVRELYE